MIHTTPPFHMPTLRLVGTLLILAALAGLPTSAWAEFRIGVWQPGGVVGVEGLFIENMVENLDALARSGMWREICVYPIANVGLSTKSVCQRDLDSMEKTGDCNKQATGLRRPDLSLSRYSV